LSEAAGKETILIVQTENKTSCKHIARIHVFSSPFNGNMIPDRQGRELGCKFLYRIVYTANKVVFHIVS